MTRKNSGDYGHVCVCVMYVCVFMRTCAHVQAYLTSRVQNAIFSAILDVTEYFGLVNWNWSKRITFLISVIGLKP